MVILTCKLIIMKAIWNNKVIAESDNTLQIEGNHYFPAHSISREYFKDSEAQTSCHWKGIAGYYDIEVDGQTNQSAAWFYSDPTEAAAEIKDHVAFWRGVRIES